MASRAGRAHKCSRRVAVRRANGKGRGGEEFEYLRDGAGRERVERRLRTRPAAGDLQRRLLHGLRELRLLLHQLAHRIAQEQRLIEQSERKSNVRYE